MTAVRSHDLDLTAILDCSELAYAKVREQFPGSAPAAVREHFNTDVPALISVIQRLTADIEAMTAIARGNKRYADDLLPQIRAAYAFGDEMATYCSHMGVAAEYARRLRERLHQASPGQGRTDDRPKVLGGLECDLAELEAVDPQVRVAADQVAAVSDEILARARRNRASTDPVLKPPAVGRG